MKGIGKIGAATALVCAMTAVAGSPAAATIEQACNVTVSDASVDEGDSGTTTLRFVVSARNCSTGSVNVRTGGPYSTRPASPASDYRPVVSRTLNWSITEPAGDRAVEVTVTGDTTPEDDELVWLELFDATNVIVTDMLGVGTIRNDDGDDSNVGLTEPDDSLQPAGELYVVISRRLPIDVTVFYATVDDTARAGEDFVGVSRGAVTIPAGQIAAPIRIAVNRDHLLGAPEYFHVRIFEPSLGTIAEGLSRQRVTIPLL